MVPLGMEVGLNRVLMIVERLVQEAHRLVTQRLQRLDLVKGKARNDGVATLTRALVGPKEESLILHDRSSKRAAELLSIEGRLNRVAVGIKDGVVGLVEELRCVRVELVVTEEAECGPVKA